jgi:hypothetical protein
MEILTILFMVALAFFTFYLIRSAKRHLILKSLEYLLLIVGLIVAYLYLSKNFDFGDILGREATILKTGAAILEGIKDALT